MPDRDSDLDTFPCLACGTPTKTGTFCGDTCERWIGSDIPDDPPGKREREVMLEALCWDAYREALQTGVWH